MVNIFLFLLILGGAIFVKGDEKYSGKYDSIDYKAILNSERLLKHYYKCLMDEGPCTPEGNELRTVLPDSLQTECIKCTDKQKEAAKDIIEYFVKNKQDWWRNLLAKYDPQGIYKEKYEEEWKQMGYPL